ncbi:MAG: trypsin-like peptidase domain-containing protein [Vicingus serpentipes]|nr:trypsin-like peptidase domain-containing protein [Vicingus serpentipes]
MRKNIKLLVSTLGIALIGGLSAITVYKAFEKEQTSALVEETSYSNLTHLTNNKSIIPSAVTSFELAAEISINAVVHVKTEIETKQPIDPLYHFFYGSSYSIPPQIRKSSGSGVLISNDGYIVTNNHVIENANNISITLNNKKTYNAEVIGSDPTTDLALLKIDEDKLPFITYGNSNNIKVGEWVLAVGNPYNLTSTVTAGIVSAKGRDINILRNDPYNGLSAIESFIQTDAAVNPGNSGGALVSTTGELIGINSAIQSPTGAYSGYSFAIPVNIVKKVVEDLKEFGNVQRAFLGVTISDLDENLAKELGTNNLNGVYVGGLTGGSAEKTGIKEKDIIRKIGNKTINNVPELQEEMSQFRPGDEIIITVSRNDKTIKIPVTLKNYNGDESVISSTTENVYKLLGAKFSNASKKEIKNLGLEGGVKIDQLYNGKLRSVGVREGFIITKINHQKIKSTENLITTIEQAKGGILMEGVYENGRREFYGFGMR